MVILMPDAEDYKLVKASDSRKWHWYELDAEECFCGNVKSFAISKQVGPDDFGDRDVSSICLNKFRVDTRSSSQSVETGSDDPDGGEP